MHVAHCIQGLGLGGAQQVVREIAARADSESFEFFVYAAEDGFFRDLLEQAGATVRIIPRVLRRFDPLWLSRLALAMRRDGIELVHCHLFGDTLHGYLAARLVGVEHFIMTLHCDLRFQPGLQRLGYRWLLRRHGTAVACSAAAANSIASECRSTFGPVLTIPNGVSEAPASSADPEARSRARTELGIDPEKIVIASIGRLDPDKGPELLIDAFARLVRAVEPGHARQLALVLFGEGSLEASLRERARQAGVADRVQLAGLRRDIRELMPAIDVVAFTSPAEGLSMALLETMAAGGCLVAADVPGNREAVSDAEAVLAKSGDEASLAAALERATMDPALRAHLGAAALRRYREEFSVERMVGAYQSLYRTLCPSAEPEVAPDGSAVARPGSR